MDMELVKAWAACCMARAEPRPLAHVLLAGPASSGKTALLCRALGAVVPARGAASRVELRDMDITFWEVGASLTEIRGHYKKAHAIAFVVDSAAHGDLAEARDMLWDLLAEAELQDSQLLVLANKQDAPGAKTLEEVGRRLRLQRIRGRRWVLHAASAKQGFGMHESLDWLQDELRGTVARPSDRHRFAASRGGG
mmetsp:Transcript_48042/g.138360  ORF Transcript_48042/g.138360 Transcript_48042/m.138360 type:complete len:195 (-) Transcript_48042:257-841(-)